MNTQIITKIFIVISLSATYFLLKAQPITKPIGNNYQKYLPLVQEAHQSLHPSYKLEEKIDYIMHPLDLICWWRFDIIAKYIYALHRELSVQSEWAKELYLEHIRVWGNCREWDGSKITCDDFLDAFHNTLQSIKTHGFDPTFTKIRIDMSKYPCDGSHRIAASLLYGHDVVCNYYTKKPHATYSSALFFKHYNKFISDGLAEKYIDAMALEYCNLKKQTRMCIIFDSYHVEIVKKALRAIGNIVYEKKVKLSKRGFKQLMRDINYNDVDAPNEKIIITTLLFEYDDHTGPKLDQIILEDLKLCYLSPSYEKGVEWAQLFFVNNSIVEHNTRKKNITPNFFSLLQNFDENIKKSGLNKEHFCIISKAVDAQAGLKDCDSMLCLYHSEQNRPLEIIPGIIFDNAYVFQKNIHQDDIIFNPQNHFYYKGFKFARL